MSWVFTIARLIIISSIPFWCIVLLLFLLKQRIGITYSIDGFFSISNIQYAYVSDLFSLFGTIERIELTCTWFRLRILVTKSNISLFLKKSNVFLVSSGKARKDQDYQERISDVKEKYNQIIQELFIKENKGGIKLISNEEIENISKVLQLRSLNIIDVIILNILNLFDVYLQHLQLNIKIEDSSFYHTLSIRKIIVGFVNAKNKKTEIDIIVGVYDLCLYEYYKTDKKSSHFKHNKIFSLRHKTDDCWYCYQLIHLPETVAKIKFSSGLLKPICSLPNTISITIESKELLGSISSKSMNNIIHFILDIIAISKMAQSTRRSNSNKHHKQIETIEEYIKELLDNQLKKIALIIQTIKLSVCSDNFIFKHVVLESNEIKMDMHNNFYISKDNNGNLNMLSSELLINFSQLKVSQFNNQRLVPITEISAYSIPIKKNIYYNIKTKKAEVLTTLTSKLSNVEVILKAESLNKILEIVLIIVDGIELIEYYSKQSFSNSTQNEDNRLNIKSSDNFADKTNMDFSFENINAVLYSDEMITFANQISMKLLLNKWKNHKDEMALNFSPIKVSFSHNEMNSIINNYYVGNAVINNFGLTITKLAEGKDINIVFGETFAIAHDIHLIYIMKFISEMIGAILEKEVVRKFGNVKRVKKKKKNNVMLKWVECEIVNYINQTDIIYGQFKDFTLVVDKHLAIPNFKAYHSSAIKCNFIELMNFDNFFIEFKMEEKEINILFDNIFLNAYTPLLASPIQKISTFYKFFPIWLDYYFLRQFVIDEETQLEKFEIQKNKKDKVKISFAKLYIGLNDNCISQAGILQAKVDDLRNKTDVQIIKYLHNIKKDLLNIQVSNFEILCNTERRVVPSSSLDKAYYYDSIKKIANIGLRFELIQINLENYDLITLRDLKIDAFDQIEFSDFIENKISTTVIGYLKYYIVIYKVASQSVRTNKSEIQINDFKFNFEDIQVFDKSLNFIITIIKTLSSLKFIEYETRIFTDTPFTTIDKCFNLTLSNFDGTITSIDPITKEAYNKLEIKIAKFALTNQASEMNRIAKQKILELSLHYFVFGFDPSQKSGFPLLIMPLAEANLDLLTHVLRINIPTEISNQSSYARLFNQIYSLELNQLVMETKSLTLFVNYKYLSTFFKIFGIFWEKTKSLRNSLKNKNSKSTIIPKPTVDYKNNYYRQREPKPLTVKVNHDNSKLNINDIYTSALINNSNQTKRKILFSLFDLKVIYLLEYKKEYETIFKFHPFVQVQKYFGYIFRLYSFSFKYELTNEMDSFYSSMNLLTISFLDDDNFEDANFFLNDREIKTTKFLNLKQIHNFNAFMELDKANKLKLINNNLREYLKATEALNEKKYKEFRQSSTSVQSEARLSNLKYNDLKFDYKHIFAKVSNVFFISSRKLSDNNTNLSLTVDNTKLTWNKFNKDVLILLLFDDVLLIVDQILLKTTQKKRESFKDNLSSPNSKMIVVRSFTTNDQQIYNAKANKTQNNLHNTTWKSPKSSKTSNTTSVGQMNFVFEIKNPQIVIQNEIKKSTLLLMTKKPIRVVISKFFFIDNLKDFKLEFICDFLSLYSAPKCINSEYINWIGDSNDNKYYLDESLFGQILETPKIRFLICQKVESYENNGFNVDTSMKITVDKIKGDFESSYFTDFMNIVEVFLFDRGYSFAEEKGYLDSKKKDMETFKLLDLENAIKNIIYPQGKKPLQKEITFSLGEVIFNLSKGGKALMQFLLINFDGNHQIFNDKSSETHLNVRNFHIRNAEQNRNDIILSPLYSDRLGDYEDKINIVTFTKKDHFVSIGTDSLWYVLDYLEFSVRPIIINISKAQIEFIIDFFFQDQSLPSEEDQMQVLISSNTVKQDKKKELFIPKKENKKEDNYPIYFKHYKVNETEVLLNFEYGDAHPLNIPRTKLKFGVFDKQEKFYPFSSILQRFTSHCKKQCIKNLGAILGGLFSSSENTINFEKKRKENDEQNHRKLLFGSK